MKSTALVYHSFTPCSDEFMSSNVAERDTSRQVTVWAIILKNNTSYLTSKYSSAEADPATMNV